MQGIAPKMFDLFTHLFHYLAIFALSIGMGAYFLSYLVGFLPMLKPHALVIQVVGIVLVVLGGYYVADENGYQRRVAEDQAEIDRLNSEARAKEAELNVKIDKANGALRKAKNDIQTKVASLNARVDSGELRLPAGCVQADPSAADGNQTNASESNRQVVKDIIAIAADGDRAITSLNACLAQYNQVMETVNAGVK
jgi:hypothetical protein